MQEGGCCIPPGRNHQLQHSAMEGKPVGMLLIKPLPGRRGFRPSAFALTLSSDMQQVTMRYACIVKEWHQAVPGADEVEPAPGMNT